MQITLILSMFYIGVTFVETPCTWKIDAVHIVYCSDAISVFDPNDQALCDQG